ncbi:RNA polymerase subunit sigma [Streptomyces sp. NPDC002309]
MERAHDAVPIVELLDERRHLLEVAYRLLGDSAAAESAIDETYRRWYGLSTEARARIEDPGPWLAGVAHSIGMSRLAGALPEKGWPTEPEDVLGKEVGAVLRNALYSFSPSERAAFLLSEVFGAAPTAASEAMPVADAARATHLTLDNPRARPPRPAAAQRHDELARALRQACLAEDEALLRSLLAPDSAAVFDGGGKVRALVTPVRGGQQVARTLLTLLPRSPRTSLHNREVNGRTGLVVYSDRRVAAVISLEVAERRIQRICVMLNPDKLRTWNGPDDSRTG